MAARELKTNTAVIVVVGPFFDKTTGVDIEPSLTITNEKITLTAETDDGSAPTLILDNITGATSGTDNDLNYIANSDNGMMQIELSAANLNRLGRMRLTITDAANHVPVWEDFEVVSAQYYDAKYGTGSFYADERKILGTALTETSAGYLAAGFKKLLDVATPLLAIDAAGLDVLVDRILTRAFGSVTYTGTTRCVLTALQALRNKFTAAAGAAGYVVMKENDSTTSWTGTLAVDGNGIVTAMAPDS
jgi:hypothetical protein